MNLIREKKTYLLAAGVVILLTAYWSLVGLYPVALFAAAMALLVLGFCLKSADAAAFLVMLVPNVMLVKYEGFGGALLGYVLLLFALRLVLLERKKITVDNRFAALVIAHLVIVGISVILNRNTSLVSSLARFLGMLIFALWIIGNCKGEEKLREKLLDAYVFGCVLNVISTFVFHHFAAEVLQLRFFAGINNDRNYFSAALAVGMQFALIRLYANRRIDVKNCVYLLILLLGGIVSASRTFIVLCVFALVLFILTLMNLSDRKQLRIVLPLLALVAVGGLLSPVGGKLLEVLRRFTGENVLSANKRTDEWVYYLGRAFSTPLGALFGAGSAARVIAAGEYRLAEHSTYVQAIFETGLLGLGSFIAVIVALARRSFNGARRFAAYLPLLTLLVAFSMLSAYYSDLFNYSLMLCLCALSAPEMVRIKEERAS